MALTAVKGFNDILPEESGRWQHIEQTARRVFELNGFGEIRVPVLEKTELFSRSIGDGTDIVEKEMYTFTDKGENNVTLRPEGTAGVMRAFIEHKLYALDPVSKLYYMGPMFRYERPQKGRYRQFHQIGAEITGVNDPLADAQLLNMLTAFFREIGLDEPTLQINSLGCPSAVPPIAPHCEAFWKRGLISYVTIASGALSATRSARWIARPRGVLRPPPVRRPYLIISAADATVISAACAVTLICPAPRTVSMPAWCAALTITPARPLKW